ncbi:hypothetical protein ITJ44_15485 [Clavibacter sp. VKM Ac-2873]|uniref:hypothetical protein n=1 Tax=Clavibacter sp. VKM Ac-2873 TaxID=2783813 RepID=UPI00188ACC3F|nr:hypothetical protein [Clavibacter sp. VKM Ac-2873]MBF4619479.1 hypothetical protein [Clavibacter sp. VKM Ac-2873]
MQVLLHGIVIDGPLLADDAGAITATFTCADPVRGGSSTSSAACCEVVCRGSLAVTVLLGLDAGERVCVSGELRLHRPPSGSDEDLVLASLETQSITHHGTVSCTTRIGHAANESCF